MLDSSAERLAEIERLSRLGSWVWDIPDDRVTFSEELYRLFAMDPDAVASYEKFLEAVYPDDRETVKRATENALETGGEIDYHFRIVRPDGSMRTFHARGEIQLDEEGNPIRLFGTDQDVTELVETQRALTESEEKYRILFENSPLGIGVADLDGRLLAYNDAILEPGGYTREEIPDTATVADFYYDPAERDRILAMFQEQGVVRDQQVRLKARDGSPYYGSLSLNPATFEGRPCVVSLVQDITDRVLAEEASQYADEQRRLILSQIDEIVYLVEFDATDVVDPGSEQFLAGRVAFVSERSRSMVGCEPQEFIDDPSLWFDLVHPGDRDVVVESTQKILGTGDIGTRVYRLRHRETGEYIWVEDQVVPQRDSDGAVTGFLGVARDITERMLSEDALRRSEERLRLLAARLEAIREEERTSIAREIHDELGQVLTVLKTDLLGCIQMLPADSEEVVERALAIAKLLDHAIRMVQDISSRLRPAILDHLGLAAAIEWQAQTLQERTGLRFDVRSEVGPLDLPTERTTALFRILQEALTNVVRHAGADEVAIDLRSVNGDLVLAISDDGIGIDEDAADDPSSLGLLGMRERTAQLGGTVAVKKRAEGGTRIEVRVPV